MVKEIVMALVKPGDMVEITPIPKVPNAERRFKVNEVLDNGFLYGLSTTCDGYVMPFAWIQDIKIVA